MPIQVQGVIEWDADQGGDCTGTWGHNSCCIHPTQMRTCHQGDIHPITRPRGSRKNGPLKSWYQHPMRPHDWPHSWCRPPLLPHISTLTCWTERARCLHLWEPSKWVHLPIKVAYGGTGLLCQEEGWLTPPSTGLPEAQWGNSKKKSYPLLLISDVLTHLHDARFFTALDLQWGFNNMWIKDGDEWKVKVAFQTNWGLFNPTIMFFKLCNSPATF